MHTKRERHTHSQGDTQIESDTHTDRDTHIQEDKHTPESETHTCMCVRMCVCEREYGVHTPLPIKTKERKKQNMEVGEGGIDAWDPLQASTGIRYLSHCQPICSPQEMCKVLQDT